MTEEGRTKLGAIRDDLLAWFDAHARDLPWRRTRDPYAIHLSEIMLQQTRVDTVIPYFLRFLERFPTVTALAEAPVDAVLELWSGLGYYRRARSLHLAAREVVARYGGAFPSDRAGLEGLPGVGAYTAGAIASIAFGREEPLVDGNVARVLSRLFAIEAQLGTKESNAELWRLAGELVRGPRPGDFNQSLMELGATVCAPSEPRCGACPVRRSCSARAEGRQRTLPLAKDKRPPRQAELVALVLGDPKGEMLFAKRAPDGLFGGLWEPPMLEPDDARANALTRGARKVGEVEHVLTHRALTVSVLTLDRVPSPLPEPPHGYVEVAVRSADGPLGVSTLARKILALASGASGAKKPARRTATKAKTKTKTKTKAKAKTKAKEPVVSRPKPR